ncbi:MAG TPA: alpha/beta hydrolase [Anaeromyxobacteraceae bacterium]|nr:alpha/beta hydrolase [Anaeromyxobacteraceae bacterium]
MEWNDHLAAARDGTRIAWSDAGRGAPAVVLCDGIGCAGFVWRHLAPALARTRRLVHWTYRGHGASGAPADPGRATLLDCVDDLLAVLDAAGERRVVLAGHSMGVQVCLEAHRRAPRRVAGLVLLCGAPGHALAHFHDRPALAAAFPVAQALVERFPEAARLAFRTMVPSEAALLYAMIFEVNARLLPREDMVRYLRDLSGVEPTLFVQMLASAQAHDAADHLAAVNVPTLIVAGELDTFTPMWLSVKMQTAIRGSELLVLPGGTHVGPLEHPELVGLRVERWFRDRFPGRRAAARLRPARRARAARARGGS